MDEKNEAPSICATEGFSCYSDDRIYFKNARGKDNYTMKNLKYSPFLLAAGTVILSLLYMKTSYGILLSLAITFGTITYHFAMRLLTGLVFSDVMNNRADYRKKGYQVGKFEMSFYEKLKVKKWKQKMPTYDVDLFNPRIHTWDEIAQAMCQAELVHETIVVLSFLPIVEGIWFGAYPIFVITSVLSAGFDMMFVMIQRYNRQRIMKIARL